MGGFSAHPCAHLYVTPAAVPCLALAGAMRSLHDSRSIELTSWVASNPTLAQKSTVTSINNAVFWRSKRCRNKNHVLHALHQS